MNKEILRAIREIAPAECAQALDFKTQGEVTANTYLERSSGTSSFSHQERRAGRSRFGIWIRHQAASRGRRGATPDGRAAEARSGKGRLGCGRCDPEDSLHAAGRIHAPARRVEACPQYRRALPGTVGVLGF